MHFRNHFFLFVIIYLCLNMGTGFAQSTQVIEEVEIDNLFGENDDIFNNDTAMLRSFDDVMIEETPIPIGEKIEMFFIILRSKTRSYQGGLLEHLQRHSNEYLLGSTCLATILLAALITKYTGKITTHSHDK